MSMRRTVVAVLAITLAGCGSATGRIAPDQLGVSARDAYVEARTVARSWADDARLRWVQGSGINAQGVALAGEGEWHFHYTAPGQTGELLVRVRPLETVSEEQPVQSPPGYVIGDNVLGTGWIDSGAALDAAASAAGSPVTPTGLLLIPTRPPQWLVRADAERWRVHAETGEVLEP